MFDVVLGTFALVGFITVTIFVASKIRGGSLLEREWRQSFAGIDLASKVIFKQRMKPHCNTWHIDYAREFSQAVSGLLSCGATKQLQDEGIAALPMFFHLLAHIPDDLLDTHWRHARETADAAGHRDGGKAVLWDLVWLILSAEQLGRMAQNEGQHRLAADLKLRAGGVFVPGMLKVDNILVDQ